MFAFLRSRRYAAICVVLALTITVALVQLYYAATPISPRELYHHGLRAHHNDQHGGRHGRPHRDDVAWDVLLRRPRAHKPRMNSLVRKKTFLMLKTGGEVMWSRLPVHRETTLKSFQHFSVYADDAARIEGIDVIDILRDMPSEVLEDSQLSAYRMRQQVERENWGWGNNEIAETSGWASDKFKNVPMLLHAWRTAPKSCDWFIMIDDDTYLITESVAAIIADKNPDDPWYIGSSAMINGLTFAHGGSGLIISRGALDMVFGGGAGFDADEIVANYSRNALNECCGDFVAGLMLRDIINLNVNDGLPYEMQVADPFQGNALFDTQLKEEKWCAPLASYHHIDPWEIAFLHEWEHRLGPHSSGGALNSDVYIDLYLPFMTSDRDDWKFGASGYTFTNESDDFFSDGDRRLSPVTSKEDCKRSCELSATCLGWEFEAGQSCTLEKDRIIRGRAHNRQSKHWKEGQGAVSSGWMLDRIRGLRANQPCDPLQYDEETKTYNDDDSTSEGWYFRLNGRHPQRNEHSGEGD